MCQICSLKPHFSSLIDLAKICCTAITIRLKLAGQTSSVTVPNAKKIKKIAENIKIRSCRRDNFSNFNRLIFPCFDGSAATELPPRFENCARIRRHAILRLATVSPKKTNKIRMAERIITQCRAPMVNFYSPHE